MRTAGLASILLLASGSVLGLPQYGQNQDNTDDSGTSSVSGEFWWQQGNAFQGASGGSVQDTLGNIFNQVVNAFNTTVSQATSQDTSSNTITPQQSEYCPQGQGCVPWQLCPDGTITTSSNVVPGLIPYPSDAGFTGCGNVRGNVCCGIPKDVLTQQQEQSNAPNVYDTCSAGLLCVAIEKCNLYNGFIEPQVEQYAGQAYIEYNKCKGDGAIESVCCQAKPSDQGNQAPDVYTTADSTSSTQQNQNAGEYSTSDGSSSAQETQESVPYSSGDSSISAVLTSQCASNQDCVPYFQCINGVINTDGAGLLDVRTKPRATCAHPDYPEVPAICCDIPGAPAPVVVPITPKPVTPPPTPSADPANQCDGYKVCVSQGQCDASGNVITDGGGLIDIRIVHKRCYVDGTTEVGACCTPPGAPPPIPQIDICPKGSPCIDPSLCTGEALDSTGSWISYAPTGNIFSQCTVGSGSYSGPGVCCINPIPQVDICPQGSCIDPSLCTGDALDGTGSWTSYAPTGNIFSQCTVGSGSYSGPGVCCINPIPQVDICPRDSPCIDPSLCTGEALDGTGSWTSYAPTGNIFSQCTVGSGLYSGPGVCCINPIPQVDICPRDSPCIDPSLCTGEALDGTGSWTSYAPTGNIFSQCPVGSGSYSGPGVCCINPIPQVEICPRESPCIDPSLCTGEALDSTGSWTAYAPTGKIFSQCTVGSGSYSGPGLCCINPVVTPAPVIECPDYNECVPESHCDANGNIVTDGSGLIDIRLKGIVCYTDAVKYETGVCCKPPPPPTPVINVVDSCPGQTVCVPGLLCTGQALDNDGSMVSYAPGGIWSSCYLAGDASTPGICCEKPPPPILNKCPGKQVCVDQNQCDINGNVVTDGAGSIDIRYKGVACYTDAAAYTEGVCCTPPFTITNGVVDICPAGSSCVPEYRCSAGQSSILYSTASMDVYNPGGSWAQCQIGAGVKGVCCTGPLNSVTTPAPATEPLIASSLCGRRNQKEVLDLRIQSTIATNEAQFGEFPWQGIIFFSNYTFKCGASLIGDRWLMTGGHCVSGYQPSDIQVRLGEWQVNSFDEPLSYVDVQIKSITVHPDFNPKNVQNNIAVLELAEPVEVQYHINSICLPSPGQTFWNQKCIISGWGKDSFEGSYQHIIKKVEVPTVDKSTCQALLRKTRLGKWFVLHDSFMCAGGEENKDACKGDGGGPLACEDPATGRYYLAGMTSWGIGCGNKDVPGVYADVQGFSTWIQGVIGGTLDQQQQVVGPVVGPEVETTNSNPYGK